jgi:hypothetical protein
MRISVLKIVMVVFLPLVVFSTAVLAQSIPHATGDGPSWGWVAGFALLILLALIGYTIRGYNSRIDQLERAHAALQVRHEVLKDKIAEHHLDANQTRQEISIGIRLAVAEHLPLALQPLQEAIAKLATNHQEALASLASQVQSIKRNEK